MATDKGTLTLDGQALVRRARDRLLAHCRTVYVSVHAEQVGLPSYAGLPLVIDDGNSGPAAGLLAAWALEPAAALLVLAVDMPGVDAALLNELVRARNADAFATVFESGAGMLEPLCAIWEPRSRRALLASGESSGGISPRRVLENAAVERVVPSDASKLVSINTPAEFSRFLGTLVRDR